MTVPIPYNEAARLEALRRYAILDTAPDAAFDHLALIAAYICQTPFAFITFIDAERQWFKSCVGVKVGETAREESFCAHAILGDEVLIVEDARADERFAANPFVTGEPHIRFYAGAPLITPRKFKLGTLCILDTVPRRLRDEQISVLRLLSAQIVGHLMQRREIASYQRAVEVYKRREIELRARLDDSSLPPPEQTPPQHNSQTFSEHETEADPFGTISMFQTAGD